MIRENAKLSTMRKAKLQPEMRVAAGATTLGTDDPTTSPQQMLKLLLSISNLLKCDYRPKCWLK